MTGALWNGAVQPEHQAAVRVVGIVQAVLIGEEGSEHPAEFNQMVPILGRTRQAAQL